MENILSKWNKSRYPRILVTLLILAISIAFLWGGFVFLKDTSAPKLLIVLLSIIWGVGGIALLFWVINWFVEQLPTNAAKILRPFVFIGPALLLLLWFLVAPTFRTVFLSFFDRTSENFVGFENYIAVFTSRSMLEAFRNNLLWLVFGTFLSTFLGLVIAILADRSKFEKMAKSIIFMPTAISFVGASIIWKFVYTVKPTDVSQIGLLNAIIVALGGQPVPFTAWTAIAPWNNLFLILIFVWLQTGFAMMLFSAAIKGVSPELIDAGRVDGANELQIFFKIIIPNIKGTIITTATTIAIFTLKIFDVVIVMTGGQFGTEVIATNFYRQYFSNRNFGFGSAIAIVLLVLVIPVMVYNLKNYNEKEAF